MKKCLLSMIVFGFAFVCGTNAQSIGLIGDATPGGWDVDTNMVQDPDSAHLWTLRIKLFNGAVKFRQDDDWAMNWGAADFPRGIGTQGGPNIPVLAGDYDVSFNSNTGAYYFDVDSDIGIIGDATPGGWDFDTDMYQDQTDPNKFFIELDLAVGEAKFRKDDDWAVNWGAADFPTGTGVQGGPNIPVNPAGRYLVTLDTMTGEYEFSSDVSYSTIGLIGDAVNGWDEDVDMIKDPENGEMWTLHITLSDGEAKFRAEDDWATSWGSMDFPTGTGELGGPNIPVTAGEYFITFNSTTGEYNFKTVVVYSTIGIIGNATPGGWDTDSDLMQDPMDPHSWSIRMMLSDGEAKFRANDEWVVDWGAGDFPSGTGVQGGANIPIPAGDYIISFNSLSGVYNFKEVVEYSTVGLIGKSGPNADWENDVPLTKDAADFNVWTLDSVMLTTKDPDADDEGVKFRANNDWAVNWGADAFPAATGVQDGPNIPTVAGIYSVMFNSSTGDYTFSPPSSTIDRLSPDEILLFPNPTKNYLYVELETDKITGDIDFSIIDVSGKILIHVNQHSTNIQPIDVSSLPNGNYILRIKDQKYLVAKNFSTIK